MMLCCMVGACCVDAESVSRVETGRIKVTAHNKGARVRLFCLFDQTLDSIRKYLGYNDYSASILRVEDCSVLQL